jgi:hypothetical protein
MDLCSLVKLSRTSCMLYPNDSSAQQSISRYICTFLHILSQTPQTCSFLSAGQTERCPRDFPACPNRDGKGSGILRGWRRTCSFFLHNIWIKSSEAERHLGMSHAINCLPYRDVVAETTSQHTKYPNLASTKRKYHTTLFNAMMLSAKTIKDLLG